MDGGDDGNLVIKKRFVSEAELDERRKRRQEEWEKVRKPEDPEECPEEVYDPRSLYERLQEQKDRKQQEYEEQFKFKNMVRGLDEDETNFLDEVSRQQELLEKQRREEELKELKEYRSNLNKVGISPENKKEVEKKVAVKPIETKNKFSQAKLLAGAVKHKSSESGNSVKRLKSDPGPDDKSQDLDPSPVDHPAPSRTQEHRGIITRHGSGLPQECGGCRTCGLRGSELRWGCPHSPSHCGLSQNPH
ncbi:PSME3-interacting protein isoform X2 [Canis lupus dingo]|uniref:PSME3-interacting protein isoform X2 n=1 Tax=Canis lupus dingo TaxID=286419 RepID=UPI0020C252A0|nr:PSME3-interacting protein isoform X2 [Canis lupus dingo]